MVCCVQARSVQEHEPGSGPGEPDRAAALLLRRRRHLQDEEAAGQRDLHQQPLETRGRNGLSVWKKAESHLITGNNIRNLLFKSKNIGYWQKAFRVFSLVKISKTVRKNRKKLVILKIWFHRHMSLCINRKFNIYLYYWWAGSTIPMIVKSVILNIKNCQPKSEDTNWCNWLHIYPIY